MPPDIETWVASQVTRLGIADLSRFRSLDESGWRLQDGALLNDWAQHRAIVVRAAGEQRQWPALLMIEPLGKPFARILQVFWRDESGDPVFLVQAKEEPGNDTPGRLVVTTTVQAGVERLARESVPYRELLDGATGYSSMQDPGMFFEKRSEILVRELQAPPDVIEGYYAAELSDLRWLGAQGLLSEFVLQALGVILLRDDAGPGRG